VRYFDILYFWLWLHAYRVSFLHALDTARCKCGAAPQALGLQLLHSYQCMNCHSLFAAARAGERVGDKNQAVASRRGTHSPAVFRLRMWSVHLACACFEHSIVA
jgi:hypothetical protein